MNIQELRVKVKELTFRLNTRELYTVLLILLVGFGSFGLGRLSKLQEGKVPIRIERMTASVATGDFAVSSASQTTGQALPATSSIMASGGKLVASKGGTKYHFPWCSGAQRISDGNKVWFNSAEDARKAGYTPASNCKGLK